MTRTFYIRILILLLAAAPVFAKGQESFTNVAEKHNIAYGVIDRALIPYAYSGTEKFRYDISYTGGIKLGELYLELAKIEGTEDSYKIRSRATTSDGLFEHIYPIDDLHVTKVSGPKRLPYHYEVWQKEGFSYEAHKVTKYDQKEKKIYYKHNEYPVKTFEISDTAQNEFSAFFASRLMDFAPGGSFIVPTFADKKRIEVVVMVRNTEVLKETLFGPVKTILVEPIMTFRGLYDKKGDTAIWYTDDVCRVPVLINSKIVIGSLTATLVGYNNPACSEYNGALLEDYR